MSRMSCLLAIGILLLVGCVAVTPSVVPSPLPSLTLPTAIPPRTSSSATSPKPCGMIETRGPDLFGDANQAEVAANCFWQAYQSCDVASLTLRNRGVDTVLTHEFTLANANGKCVIHDHVSSTVVPRPPITAEVTCATLARQERELIFSACGTFGDVLLPVSIR